MKQSGQGWVSHFVNSDNIPFAIDQNNAVLTVCCRSDTRDGSHAFCILEWFDYSGRKQTKYDLTTPGFGRVQLNESSVTATRWDILEGRMGTTKHHSYRLNHRQARAVDAAFQKFKQKNAGGRYVYCREGGALGRVLNVFKGQRGVNCADLVIKILNDAGIVKVLDGLYNSPKYAASGKGR